MSKRNAENISACKLLITPTPHFSNHQKCPVPKRRFHVVHFVVLPAAFYRGHFTVWFHFLFFWPTLLFPQSGLLALASFPYPEVPWREALQGKCPQWGPRVNNLWESLLAWLSLGAVDALPLLLFQGGGICSFLPAISFLALFSWLRTFFLKLPRCFLFWEWHWAHFNAHAVLNNPDWNWWSWWILWEWAWLMQD